MSNLILNRPKVHIVLPDPHAHPLYHNDRADWMGKLIAEIKPDLVVNMGDAADLPSLSTFDKGKSSFHGQRYGADIESHLDFQERLWKPMKKSKRKMPYRIILEGNHEHRIKRALEYDPHLASGGNGFGISFKDLDFDKYYQEVYEYKGSTPSIATFDGVSYAHYFISGVMGRPIGGEHHAYSLLSKNYTSCTAAHSHTLDFATRTDTTGKKLMGLVCGVYQDYDSPWAGHVNDLWSRGCVIKRNVEDGVYDFQWISIESLKKEYG